MSGPKPGHGGRKPDPIEKKRARGNPGKRPLPERGELVPVPPVDSSIIELTVEQAMERSVIAGQKWLAESDAITVVLLRECLDHYVTVKNDKRAKYTEIQNALKLVMSAAADCSFTPGERTRLGLAEVTAQSKLEELRGRRQMEDQSPARRASSG